MRKAVRLVVTLWIEGDDQPAHDFAASTTTAVKAMIDEGAKKYPSLKVTVKDVHEKS